MTARTEPTIELELLLRELALEDGAPAGMDKAVALAHRVRILHEPGACVPSWQRGRGASPLSQLLLALVLAGVVWFGFLAFLPDAIFDTLQRILTLAAALLVLGALLTILLSKGRRSRHAKPESEAE